MQTEQNGYLVLRKHANPRAVRLFRALANAYRKQTSPYVDMVFNTQIRDKPEAHSLKQEQADEVPGQQRHQGKNHEDQLRNLKSTLRDLRKGFRLLKTLDRQDKK